MAAGAFGSGLGKVALAKGSTMWRMPDEGAAHTATWMAFGPTKEIWGGKLLPAVRENLAGIAKAIAAHEPVRMLVREEDYDLAVRLCGLSVKLLIQPIDDLWMRDTGPVFVKGHRASSVPWASISMAGVASRNTNETRKWPLSSPIKPERTFSRRAS